MVASIDANRAIMKPAGRDMGAILRALISSEAMTPFGPRSHKPWGSYGCYVDGAFGAGASQSLGATNSAHSRAGEVHPEEWGTGSNNRGAFSGRLSLTMPIMGGRSSPCAIAHCMAS